MMLTLGPLAFLNPWLLAGLAALPVLWWLMRAIPPSPKRQVFAGVRLLAGLRDEERQSDRTPWWLLLLRCIAVAAALIGFAQPVTNLSTRAPGGTGPLLLLMDQGWASAPDWAERKSAAREVLDEARRAGRDVLFWPMASEQEVPPPVSAGAAMRVLESLRPAPWMPDHEKVLAALQAGDMEATDTVWFSDGLSHDRTDELLSALAVQGRLRLIGPERPAKALTPPRLEDGVLVADVLRTGSGDESVEVVAMISAEGEAERRVAIGKAEFEGREGRAPVRFDLPIELQNQVTRIALVLAPSAGGAALADSAIRRVRAGLVAPESGETRSGLTSPAHYLRQALEPWAELRSGSIAEMVEADPSVIVLADQGAMVEAEQDALTEWVEAGGLLIRFAGPRLAAAIGADSFASAASGTAEIDALLPARLRRGGRVLGGALSWSTPRALGPFDPEGPFRGLAASEEIEVRTQVLAEPSPELEGRVWATLEDGTPLVTGRRIGEGHVALFHVSADAEWSSLPLSGLFVEMLGRLMVLAPGRAGEAPNAEALAGTFWRPELLMGADGVPIPASALAESVAGEALAEGRIGPKLPPGIYVPAGGAEMTAGLADHVVLNLMRADSVIAPFPDLPPGVAVETLGGEAPTRYGPWFLALALLIASLDVLGTLIASGRISIGRPARAARGAAGALAGALLLLGQAPELRAEDTPIPPEWVEAAAETTLGYVLTGDAEIDRISERAMVGLGEELIRRTAVEPGPPMGVAPGRDELSLYPILYWPLTEATLPDAEALEALARYIRGRGLLIIDTKSGASELGRASNTEMREIARALNLPPLAPLDEDHVLSRTFYLMNDYPGRWRGERVWIEAPPPTREGAEPPPADIPQFDRVDDAVSPVIVGSADWASAWAVDQDGLPLFPVGRPGDRQRELAFRFGVNTVIYALTGNYKSDQVHAPEVLRRLGQ